MSVFCVKSFGQQQSMSHEEVKAAIISMQKKIVNLTYSLEPFNCKEFVSLRKQISKDTGEQVVRLIKDRQLTEVQSDIGICLLTGLDETNYWAVTASLLSTNTPDEALGDIINPTLPYGPGFANAYTNENYKILLERLKANTTSKLIRTKLELIVSGESAKIYRDFVKHPERYNYSKAQVDSAQNRFLIPHP